MTDTPTSADVAGMTMANDAAAEKLERMMRYLVGAEERLAYRTAIAALRSAPPAPEVPDHRYCTLCGRETPHETIPIMRTETTT